jgi:hypothetical protein
MRMLNPSRLELRDEPVGVDTEAHGDDRDATGEAVADLLIAPAARHEVVAHERS